MYACVFVIPCMATEYAVFIKLSVYVTVSLSPFFFLSLPLSLFLPLFPFSCLPPSLLSSSIPPSLPPSIPLSLLPSLPLSLPPFLPPTLSPSLPPSLSSNGLSGDRGSSSDRDVKELQWRALNQLLRYTPELLVAAMGGERHREGVLTLFECLQCHTLNKQVRTWLFVLCVQLPV